MRKVLVALTLFLAAAGLASICLAAPAPSSAEKFRHADRNKDGMVDKKEIKMEQKWEHKQWMKSKNKVNTVSEVKYDKNKNGWLEPYETKLMLRDKYAQVKSYGKAGVETATEAEYDTNRDGFIDAREAEAMHQDIR